MTKNLKILTYYPSWAVYGRKYFPWDMPTEKLTHINYSCGNLMSNGTIAWHDTWSDLEKRYPERGDTWGYTNDCVYGNIKHLFELKKKNRHLKILLSIGIPTLLNQSVLADPNKRNTFVESSIQLMLDHGFDGLDYEWIPTKGNSQFRPDYGDNFALFLKELREKMGEITPKRNFLVTIAGPAATSKIDASKVELWHQHLDYISIMAYECNSHSSTSTESAVDLYIAKGVSPHRIVMGIPFYARGFSNTVGVSPTPNSDYRGINMGKESCADGNFECKAVAVCIKNTIWSYNPESTSIKMDYIISKGLGGAMSWSIDGDLHENNTKSLSKVIYNKLLPHGLDNTKNTLYFPTSKYKNINNIPYESTGDENYANIPTVTLPPLPTQIRPTQIRPNHSVHPDIWKPPAHMSEPVLPVWLQHQDTHPQNTNTKPP